MPELIPYNKLYPTEKFPLKKEINTYFGCVYGDNAIRVSIYTILMTRLGERPYLPDFGSRIHELVFEENNEVFDTLVEEYVTSALQKWEPRIDIQSVAVIHQPNDYQVHITITFRIRKPNSQATTYDFGLDRQTGVMSNFLSGISL